MVSKCSYLSCPVSSWLVSGSNISENIDVFLKKTELYSDVYINSTMSTQLFVITTTCPLTVLIIFSIIFQSLAHNTIRLHLTVCQPLVSVQSVLCNMCTWSTSRQYVHWTMTTHRPTDDHDSQQSGYHLAKPDDRWSKFLTRNLAQEICPCVISSRISF